MTIPDPGVRINGPRLVESIAQLAQIGATPEGGAQRLAFTDADRRGRELVRSWMEEAGLEVRVDGIGNVFGRRAGTGAGELAPVILGSHIDTVGNGGRYDGNLGVLAALEVARTLNDAGASTLRPLEVAFFSNEEGSRYHPDMMGSFVYIGGMTPEAAHALPSPDQSTTLGEELASIGFLGDAPLPGPVPFAYVELHIEQGPILEAENIPLGAVTGVQAILWEEITVSGAANHAGTTPMSFRHDAGLAAAEATVLARRIAGSISDQVATIGQMRHEPGLVNVVPGRVVFSVDLRNPDPDRLDQAEREFFAGLEEITGREGVRFGRRELARFAPDRFDEQIISRVEAAAEILDMPCRRIPSGAGHDAQMLSRVCPAGMIFIPSVNGISHSPHEWSRDEHITAGGDALLLVALSLLDQADLGG